MSSTEKIATKTGLCIIPVLAYLRPGCQFIVDMNLSANALVGVLSQLQDGHEKVIAHFSKTLSQPERNYCVM